MPDKLVISIKKAREILGEDSDGMADQEIIEVITTLDILAKDALQLSKEELLRKRDAGRMANLIYDIYQEKKSSTHHGQN